MSQYQLCLHLRVLSAVETHCRSGIWVELPRVAQVSKGIIATAANYNQFDDRVSSTEVVYRSWHENHLGIVFPVVKLAFSDATLFGRPSSNSISCVQWQITLLPTLNGVEELSGSAPKVNGVYSGLRPIFHPTLVELCHLTDKPTNQQINTAEYITSLAELIICIYYMTVITSINIKYT